ncbi:hypothetical protein PNP59_10260 [Halobacterium salinarum]|uniref:hypothetical protein n=1 Tax=Halobacterium salinarum TaxID=2242 RepID=UPI002557663F|nr:hypothetical protein [Halobacterium salinarum]MDL0127740.1 hypothetical protein [Halobacterium salinarum]MDL0131248.1 hypothetical protein [Halobacterium salinarum]MDL0131314.1 hypothetical protein [Halobacterium salinarum]
MADIGGMNLTWLGNDRVKFSVTSGSASSGIFSSNVSAKNSQAVLKMDQSRFEYESKQIQKTGKVSLEMQIKKDQYYRKISGHLFQYNQNIHRDVQNRVEKANYIFRTGVQGIRVGDKRNPQTTIGVSQPDGGQYLNSLLLFLEDAFYAVAGDEIWRFAYSDIYEAEYSFGFTKKRISFVYDGNECHMWVYSAEKDEVKSAVSLMES